IRQITQAAGASTPRRRVDNQIKTASPLSGGLLVRGNWSFLPPYLRANPHPIERAINKEERDQEKYQGQHSRQSKVFRRQRHRQFHSQKPEQSRELDHRV